MSTPTTGLRAFRDLAKISLGGLEGRDRAKGVSPPLSTLSAAPVVDLTFAGRCKRDVRLRSRRPSAGRRTGSEEVVLVEVDQVGADPERDHRADGQEGA